MRARTMHVEGAGAMGSHLRESLDEEAARLRKRVGPVVQNVHGAFGALLAHDPVEAIS